MRIAELQRQADRLAAIASLAGSQADLQLQARLTEFLCIRTAGFVEQCVQHIYYDFTTRRAPTSVSSFVSKRLSRIQNVKSDRLRELIQDFDGDWLVAFDSFLTEEHKVALNSVIGNRNKIAHGENVSLGLVQMKLWLGKVLEIMEFLEGQCSAPTA